MTIYLPHEDKLVTIQNAIMLDKLVLGLEAEDRLLSCPVNVDGGAGSTLLNFMLPDFTPEEELTLIHILETAAERTMNECQNSIKVCSHRLADLKGFRVLEGGGGHDG